jgi:fatty-acyl-CoA synthase
MFGLMQDRPLLISSLIEHAAKFHPTTEIVTRQADGSYDRANWLSIRNEAKRVAQVLAVLGLKQSDRVGTLAWNTRRHLELYFGVSSAGAVLHTVNPRLFLAQQSYIINHAEDSALFFDPSLSDLVVKLAPSLKTVRHYIAMCSREQMPAIDLPGLLCYDELLAGESGDYTWPEFDERSASSLCYTSGTTGNPKGVLYSHRSTLIHALTSLSPQIFNFSPSQTVMVIVPMFHANAWGTPYSAAIAGCKLVLPGAYLDGKNVYEAMRDEGVTFSQGVPTVWLMLFDYLDKHPEINPAELRLERIGTGGSALPRAMLERFENQMGVQAQQGWGMTETSPLGAMNTHLPKHQSLSAEDRITLSLKQGRGIWGAELKIVDDDGKTLPWDGLARGNLLIRGPWIASGYYKGGDDSVLDAEGYFPTGDVATIDPDGYLQLVDRAKDVIKSGGEWISSIDVENAAMSHPAVAEAAIIGVHHPKWQERPLMLAIQRPGHHASKDEILTFLAERIAKWWIPDDVIFVDELPHTATGKLLKTKLREQFKDHLLTKTKDF